MPDTSFLIKEVQHEVISAAKMMERLPNDKLDWKPHEKSMSLGQLAKHVADITGLIGRVLETEEIDFSKRPPNDEQPNGAALAERIRQNAQVAAEKLEKATPEALHADWTLRNGDHVIFTRPRAAAIRFLALNHFIHHRGQLSVYLRMLDVPVPSIYGPSADEMN